MAATKGDPKREKCTHKLVKPLFSSKQKVNNKYLWFIVANVILDIIYLQEDKESMLQQSPTDLTKSEQFELSVSDYDVTPQSKATNEYTQFTQLSLTMKQLHLLS